MLADDGDALRIARAGERRRITAAGDAGNLRGRERDDLVRRIVAIDDVEIVEIAPGRAEDHDARGLRRRSHGRGLAVRSALRSDS